MGEHLAVGPGDGEQAGGAGRGGAPDERQDEGDDVEEGHDGQAAVGEVAGEFVGSEDADDEQEEGGFDGEKGDGVEGLVGVEELCGGGWSTRRASAQRESRYVHRQTSCT